MNTGLSHESIKSNKGNSLEEPYRVLVRATYRKYNGIVRKYFETTGMFLHIDNDDEFWKISWDNFIWYNLVDELAHFFD